MRSALFAALAFGAALAAALPAVADAPQPTRPVSANLYTGRWYEIARTPNMMQGDCNGSTTDFAGWTGSQFSAVQTCHSGSATGPAHSVTVSGHVLPQTQNTKMQLAMLGGLMTQQYWILDHAADDAWLIMATPGGHYVWLMSRAPVLTPAARAAALTRIQQFGFNLSRLVFPAQSR
jgi:apolipoprotein D and lipocalin family protein